MNGIGKLNWKTTAANTICRLHPELSEVNASRRSLLSKKAIEVDSASLQVEYRPEVNFIH